MVVIGVVFYSNKRSCLALKVCSMRGSLSLTIYMDGFGWLSGLIFSFNTRGVNGKLKKVGRKRIICT